MQRKSPDTLKPRTDKFIMPNIFTQSGYIYHQYPQVPYYYIPTRTQRPPNKNDALNPIPEILNYHDIVQDSDIYDEGLESIDYSDGQMNSAQGIYVYTSTIKTPTQKPPSSYHELKPSIIHNQRPVNNHHPTAGSPPGTQTPAQS